MTEDKKHHHHLHGHGEEAELPISEFDAGSKSLAEALRVSFVILKFIMFVLILLFLVSGIFSVEPEEQAMILKFGKIRGVGEDRLKGPGLHWAIPVVEDIVRIPVLKIQDVEINSFWYSENQRRVPNTLKPGIDGYCLTRNDSVTGLAGHDYNIVHCKWKLTYLIDDAEKFFRNIYVTDPAPGESYADVIKDSVEGTLESLASDAIVTTMVNYSIDEAITTAKTDIVNDVKRLMQDKLDIINSGIKVDSMQLVGNIAWPRQVDDAFQNSIRASQEKQKQVTDAKAYYEKTMNEAEGQAQELIAGSRAYRTKVVESSKANWDYLRQILPEFKKRPELVIQKIYQDAVEEVLNNAQEKIILDPSSGDSSREIRILINRDPAITKSEVQGSEEK